MSDTSQNNATEQPHTAVKAHYYHPIDNSCVHVFTDNGQVETLMFRDKHLSVDVGSAAHRQLEDTVFKCPYGPIKKVPVNEIPDMAIARNETVEAAARAIQKIANAQVK